MPFSSDPFLELVPNRVESLLRRVRELVWRNRMPLSVTGTRPTPQHRGLADGQSARRRAVVPGTAWGKLYDQRWFHVALPPMHSGAAPRYLEWRDQGEATAHVAGVPYYGFDVAHRYVALPPRAKEVWIEGYCCQSAIWHPDATGLSSKGSLFGGAFLLERDDDAWAAWHDLQSLFDLMMFVRSRQAPQPPATLSRFGQQPPVDQVTPLYRRMLRLLHEAGNDFEIGGLAALRIKLAGALRELRDSRAQVRAVLTGHAHVDLVWLWPERIGEAKAVHTFATANRLMELYPELRFAYSQPASYRAVARRAPALAQAVAARMREGKWQATGVLEVESDTLLPCGEALARSFLMGQAEFRRLRGEPARLVWLPDVFGYSGCLPQLMRLAGVEWFFTTKLTWSAINRFPHSSFVWRGTDGSEVVAHVTQNVGYNNRLDLAELDANARGHVQSDVHPEFLHPTGYGDGGGGPTEEMCERARRLSALAGAPELRWEQPEAFFARLAERRDALPVYQGECYLEYHRGTYTTHGDLKAAFRALERAMQMHEAVAVALGAAPDLTVPWRRLVFAQFHDFIPGSSVAEVYAEGVPELQRLANDQRAAALTALNKFAVDRPKTWQAFNPLPQPWRGWVMAPKTRTPIWIELPPLASVALTEGRTSGPAAATVVGRTLANDRVRAEIDTQGWLTRLTIDGRPLALAGAARAVIYPDRPANYEAWDIDRHTLTLGEPVKTPARVRTATRENRAEIVVTRRLGRASTLTVRYELRAGEAILRIEAEVDWREQQTLLKLHFPTEYRGSSARFGAPFGSVLRGQQPGSRTADAQWEVPGSRWAAVAFDGEREGLAVITEAKYGFSARNGELTVSLLRSAKVTGSDDDHRYAAPPGLNRHRPASTFSDQGQQVIRLAVGGYDAVGAPELHPAALADTLFIEPLVYCGVPLMAGLLGIEGAPTLVAAWAMPLNERSWVLRMHEVSGQRGRAKLRLADGWKARRCGLDGAPIDNASSGEISFRPYEIVSVWVERRR